jgi:hypothetical protein
MKKRYFRTFLACKGGVEGLEDSVQDDFGRAVSAVTRLVAAAKGKCADDENALTARTIGNRMARCIVDLVAMLGKAAKKRAGGVKEARSGRRRLGKTFMGGKCN